MILSPQVGSYVYPTSKEVKILILTYPKTAGLLCMLASSSYEKPLGSRVKGVKGSVARTCRGL